MKLPKLIVIDECVEYEIVEALRQRKISVLSIMETYQGIQDIEVLKIATDNNAFLLTEDKDFGELVYRLKLKHNGILLVRFPNNFDQDLKIEKIIKVILEKFEEIETHFSVLDENKLRVKKH